MSDSKTILVIDDDADIRSFCRTVLELEGYTVLDYGSASEGGAALDEQDADLVILDVMMEEVDSGFKLAEKLASRENAPPVIMLSQIADASAQIFDMQKLKVARLINKPIQPALLLKTVAKLLA